MVKLSERSRPVMCRLLFRYKVVYPGDDNAGDEAINKSPHRPNNGADD